MARKTNRQLLELQADRIEMVLARHRAPARVAGGVVTPRWVRFHLLPALGTSLARIKRLSEELALALGAPACRISRRGEQLALEVPRPDPQPVRLLPLLRSLAPLPFGTALLGLAEDGAPLLLRFPSPDVTHVLVAGTTGSGKTALLRTIILSLALSHRPREWGFVLVDPKGRAFEGLAGLPHLVRPIIREVDDAQSVLEEVVELMERRDREGVAEPRLLVVVDELADLLLVGRRGGRGQPSVLPLLVRLAQRGREAGVHLLVATQKPSAAVVGTLLRANFPVRLVGRVASSEDARVAAGRGGTGAERLLGRGDFLAVAGGQVVRFQAAYVGQDEIRRFGGA